MAARRLDGYDTGPGGFAAAGAVRHEAFRAAFRHSAHVRWMRRLIPVAAACGFGLVIAASWWTPLRLLDLPVSLAGIAMNGSKLSMEAPRLSGYTDDKRAYRFSAERADQDVTRPTIVELNKVMAEMELEGGGTARLDSARGVLDTQTNRVDMTDSVVVQTSTGYRGTTTHASFDSKTGIVVTQAPVELSSPGGAMRADRMEVRDNGRTFVFIGRVTGDFTPSAPVPRAPIVPDTDEPPAPAVPVPQGRPQTSEAMPAPQAIPPVPALGEPRSTTARLTSGEPIRLLTTPLPQPRP